MNRSDRDNGLHLASLLQFAAVDVLGNSVSPERDPVLICPALVATARFSDNGCFVFTRTMRDDGVRPLFFRQLDTVPRFVSVPI